MLCLPLKEKKCANILCVTTKKAEHCDGDTSVVRINSNRSSPLPDAARDTAVVDDQVQVPDEFVSNKLDINVCDMFTSEHDVCFDELMSKAYGTSLTQSVNSQQESEWYLRWKQLAQHFGNHYVLPGGSTGHKYVAVLAEEVSHLTVGNYPPERVLVFSSAVLQRDCMVKKGTDVRRLLEKRISLWKEEKFDLLLQEAACCNQALRRSQHSPIYKDATVHVFTKLILRGKVKAAVRWATERSHGIVLSPDDVVDGSGGATVLGILRKNTLPLVPLFLLVWYIKINSLFLRM